MGPVRVAFVCRSRRVRETGTEGDGTREQRRDIELIARERE